MLQECLARSWGLASGLVPYLSSASLRVGTPRPPGIPPPVYLCSLCRPPPCVSLFLQGILPPSLLLRGLSCPPSFPSFLHGLLNGSSGSAPLMGKATSRQTWSLAPWGSQGGLSHRVRQTSRKSPGRVSLLTRPPGEWWLWCRGGVFQRSPRVGARTS